VKNIHNLTPHNIVTVWSFFAIFLISWSICLYM
jgi:hypothetical protein